MCPGQPFPQAGKDTKTALELGPSAKQLCRTVETTAPPRLALRDCTFWDVSCERDTKLCAATGMELKKSVFVAAFSLAKTEKLFVVGKV